MTSQEIRTAYEQFLNDFNVDDQISAVFDWIADSKERNVSHQLGILLLAMDHSIDRLIPVNGRVIRSVDSVDMASCIRESMSLLKGDFAYGGNSVISPVDGLAYQVALAAYDDPNHPGIKKPVINIIIKSSDGRSVNVFSITSRGVNVMFVK